MRKILPWIAVLVFLVAGVFFIRRQNLRADEVYLAAIRYALEKDLGMTTQQGKGVVFVQLAGKDPNPHLLAQLQMTGRKVRPGSRAESIQKLESGAKAKDRLTGEKGQYLDFSAIRWNYPIPKTFDPVTGEASVRLEFTGPELVSAHYELSRKHGTWVVIDVAHSVSG